MDNLYILARRVLLDALGALGSHRDAVILVGAQAVYLRTGEADLAVAPYTTDGDLVLDPSVLAEAPPVEAALRSAGFLPRSGDSVGAWVTTRRGVDGILAEVAVDLLVPASVSPGKARRAARLPGHDPKLARIVDGLDGVLVDADVMTLNALEPADLRKFDIRVAGPAALLVAKMFKLNDRKGTDRLSDKDALDVLRLLRGTSTEDMCRRMKNLQKDDRSASAAAVAIQFMQDLFGRENAAGIQMVVRSAGMLANPKEIAVSCLLLATDLLDELQKC